MFSLNVIVFLVMTQFCNVKSPSEISFSCLKESPKEILNYTLKREIDTAVVISTNAMNKAITCLNTTIYYESRGESELGKKYVAYTLLNRAYYNSTSLSGYINQICKEMSKPSQFSFYPAKAIIPDNDTKENLTTLVYSFYNKCNRNNKYYCINNYPYYFNENSVRRNLKRKLVKIGNHTFYLK